MFSEFQFGNYGMGDADSDKGYLVLSQYQNAMKSVYGENYVLTLDDLISRYGSYAVATIGLAANVGGTSWFSSDPVPMSDSQTNTAMKELARRGNSLIPDSVNGFTSALSATATDPSLWGAIVYTTYSTAGDIIQGAQDTGDTILDTVGVIKSTVDFWKWSIFLIPVAVGYAVWRNKDVLADAATGGTIKAAGKLAGRAFGNPKRRRRRR